MKAEERKPRCHNCIFGGKQFKLDKLTHLHCNGLFYQRKHELGMFVHPYDTLRVFNDTCKDHQFKQQINK